MIKKTLGFAENVDVKIIFWINFTVTWWLQESELQCKNIKPKAAKTKAPMIHLLEGLEADKKKQKKKQSSRVQWN